MFDDPNRFLTQASKYLDPGSLFQGDIADNLKRLVVALNITETFRDTFESFRNKIDNYFKPPAEPILWTFHQKLIFERLVKFENRLREIQVSINTFCCLVIYLFLWLPL